jgi:transposase
VARDETPGSHIGPVTQSTAIYLHHAIGISYRKAQQVMEELFGMKFAVASALAFDEKASQKGKPLYQDLREKVRATSHIHADETHWRQDGQNYFVWFAGNADLALFHIDKSRAGQVAASLLGDAYPGVLIADGYQGYNAVNPKARQSCLAHLIRKSEAVATELSKLKGKSKHPAAESFCRKIRELFAQACAMNQSEHTRSPQQNALLEKSLLARLEDLCAKPFKHPTTDTFRKRLIGKEKNQWFTFLHHPGVPPTNNHAEQSIRHMVIFRKTSFGTRCDAGSLRHSILPSLLQTAKRQGNKPRQFIQILLTRDTPFAQAALYKTPP